MNCVFREKTARAALREKVLVGIFVEIYQDWYQRNAETIVCC